MLDDMMPEPTDVVADRRRPPFCYQTVDALAAIRKHVTGAKRAAVLGVYLTLTEAANRHGGEAARGGFRAARKEIAELAGVSVDTLDRHVRVLVEAGVLRVESERVEGVHLPNVWVLSDAHPSRSVAATPSRTGAAQVLEEEDLEERVPPPIAPPAVIDPNRPTTVNRKPVTDTEYQTAREILDTFNREAGTAYTSRDWLTKVIGRLREHPSLTVEAHEVVIRRALAEPWWSGPASPSVVYGSAAQFERSVHAVRSAPTAGMTADQIRAYGAGR